MKQVPALKKLKDKIDRAVDTRGYLKSLDGSLLHVRSKHSALNVLLQSAGAIVMKQALVNAYTTYSNSLEWGKDYAFVANIHDEFQISCRPELAHFIGEKAVEAIKKAGTDLNLKCPLDGEWKQGGSWAETH